MGVMITCEWRFEMNKIFALLIISLLLSGSSHALQTSVLFGARNNGLAGGVNIDFGRFWASHLRLGLEGTTGKNPGLVYFGARSMITGTTSMPIYLAGGLVGTFGEKSQLGLTISCIVDRLFGARPIVGEIGIDFLETAKLQAQLGFKL